MAVFFSGRELIEMAMGVESNGLAFYETLVQRTENPDARVIYDYLGGEEKKHLIIFEELGKGVAGYQLPETYPGEYMQYLKALVDNAVFNSKSEAVRKARGAANEMDALAVGIEGEKDSILFYSELQDIIREKDRALVVKVIGEEKGHLRQLNELRLVLEARKATK
jgi:rubrerythrin